jgi:hypothetical protein
VLTCYLLLFCHRAHMTQQRLAAPTQTALTPSVVQASTSSTLATAVLVLPLAPAHILSQQTLWPYLQVLLPVTTMEKSTAKLSVCAARRSSKTNSTLASTPALVSVYTHAPYCNFASDAYTHEFCLRVAIFLHSDSELTVQSRVVLTQQSAHILSASVLYECVLVSTGACGTAADGSDKICGSVLGRSSDFFCDRTTPTNPFCSCRGGSSSTVTDVTADFDNKNYSRSKCVCPEGQLYFSQACYGECLNTLTLQMHVHFTWFLCLDNVHMYY